MHSVPLLRTLAHCYGVDLWLTFVSLSILNQDSQFILAEATRNTNGGNSALSVENGDRLFAGTSTLVDSWNICNVRPPSPLYTSQSLL